jgi:ATP-dependent Lon protease
MTGEITLRGHVLPVGGLKEKILAAVRAGVRTVLLPAANAADLADIPAPLRRKVRLVPCREVDDVFREALVPAPAAVVDVPVRATEGPLEGPWSSST